MENGVSSRKRSVALAVLLLLCVALCCGIIYLRQSRGSSLKPDTDPSYVGPVAFVTQYDRIVDAVDLGTVTESFTRTYEGKDGQKNTVEFAPGQARMLEATCPDQKCVGFGWHYGGELWPIACLPNSVMVQVVDVSAEPSQEPGLDGATG